MATWQVFITESKVYETTVEAANLDAAIVAAGGVDTSSLTASTEKSVSARPAAS